MAERPLHAPSAALLGLSLLACASTGTPEAPAEEPAPPPLRSSRTARVDFFPFFPFLPSSFLFLPKTAAT